jgi:ethanolamine utilization protein EutL
VPDPLGEPLHRVRLLGDALELCVEHLEIGRGHCLEAVVRASLTDACFYKADAGGTGTVFPHVIASLGHYLSAQAGLAPGETMAYLVAPPIEATVGLDAALKAADVRAVKVFPPPTETNFAAAWLAGSLPACQAAAEAYAEAVVRVAAEPYERRARA